MKRYECHPDLVKERENCSFDKEEITTLLDRDEEKKNLRRALEKEFFSDPKIQGMIENHGNSYGHEELYTNTMRKATYFMNKLQGKVTDVDLIRHAVGANGIGSAIFKDSNPFAVHFVMFIPTIMGQAAEEQMYEWLEKAWSLRMIGTYAQTELGHGTHVRGLETTATYDPDTQEFIVNTPTLSSMKWWPGGLAKTANHCILLAQLYTKGQCHGVHAFLLQIRSLDDHSVLPGIEVGDIGPKFGMKSIDNGYLRLNNVRIPLNNMLMKHSQVLADGTYIKPSSQKLTYGTMVMVRSVMAFDCCSHLKKAVTIAIRYSAVRRQSEIQPGMPEPQILDFQTQQYKLLPALASCFALHVAAETLFTKYNEASGGMEVKDLQLLPQLHALSSAIKAVVTSDATALIEKCRLSCGGHGYLMSSGLPRLYSFATVMQTLEGDNTVLLLQSARHLVKQKQSEAAVESARPPWIFKKQAVKITIPSMIEAFGNVTRGVARDAMISLNHYQKEGNSFEEAWNLTGVELCRWAEMNCREFIAKEFWKFVDNAVEFSPGTRTLLENLCDLYCCYSIMENSGVFIQYACLDQSYMRALRKRCEYLLSVIRRDCVSLVDSFDFPDECLGSCLGCWDGRAYERLYDDALKSPLNKTQVSKAYSYHLGPLIKSRL